MKKHDIAVIGAYPPPIGGVSVHVERLIKKLENSSLSYVLYNIAKNKAKAEYNISNVSNYKIWLIKYFAGCRDKIIHCQERNWYLVSALCVIKKIHKSKLIVTLHSFRENPEEFNSLKRACFFYSVKNTDYFIAVGENEKNKLMRYSCSGNKIMLLPAYINPGYKKEDDKLIPEYIRKFVNNKDFIIAANASRLCLYNNEDLYGIDMLIQLCYKLKNNYNDKSIGFVFFLPDIIDYEYYKKLKNQIADNKISGEFLFVTEKLPLYPVLKESHIFIRPTNTDGDAISVREALYYKVPCIASDVVSRPEGTILFKNRDINDLLSKTVHVINNYNLYKEKLQFIKIEDNSEKLMDLYNACLNRR